MGTQSALVRSDSSVGAARSEGFNDLHRLLLADFLKLASEVASLLLSDNTGSMPFKISFEGLIDDAPVRRPTTPYNATRVINGLSATRNCTIGYLLSSNVPQYSSLRRRHKDRHRVTTMRRRRSRTSRESRVRQVYEN
jgi:hypothetical protein